MKTNIFIAESPLQLLSAAEAYSRNQGDHNVLIIRYASAARERNNSQLSSIVNKVDWNEIVETTSENKSFIKYFFSLRKFLNELKSRYGGSVNYLYMGEFRSDWMHYIRSAIVPNKTFLLDDGAVTIRVQQEFLANQIYFPGYTSNSKLKLLIKKNLFNQFLSNTVINEKINLFTAFNMSPLPDQDVIQHQFDYVRSIFGKGENIISDKVFFFGSKYSESDIVSREAELKILLDIKHYYIENFGLDDLTYIAHRDESDAKLSLIELELNIPVVKPELPGELFLLQLTLFPSHIGGFYTTLMPNAKVIFPSASITSFRLPKRIVNPHNRNAIDSIYKFYCNLGIRIKTL